MVACTLETLARSACDSPGRHPRARAYVYRHTFSCPRRARLTRRVLIPTRPAGSINPARHSQRARAGAPMGSEGLWCGAR